MIRLRDPGLDQDAGERLHVYQQEVNDAQGYAQQVARAKELFSKRKQCPKPDVPRSSENIDPNVFRRAALHLLRGLGR